MLQQTSDTAVQWRFEAESQTAPGLQDIRHNAQKYTNLYWFHAGSIIVHNDVLCLDWLMQKQELNTKARKTNPKQKMKHPRCQAFESASEAMQVFAKLPIVRNRNCLKNALKCRCEPEPPYHKLWPLIQISDLQLKTRNPKNSKPSPRLQTPFAIEDLGLQPRSAHTLFYRKQTSFHCKPKPLVATPLLQEFEARGFLMFLLLPTKKNFITNRNLQLQPKTKSLNATQNP